VRKINPVGLAKKQSFNCAIMKTEKKINGCNSPKDLLVPGEARDQKFELFCQFEQFRGFQPHSRICRSPSECNETLIVIKFSSNRSSTTVAIMCELTSEKIQTIKRREKKLHMKLLWRLWTPGNTATKRSLFGAKLSVVWRD
jgi:hypothetical protein